MDPTNKINFSLTPDYPQQFPKSIELSDPISLSFLSLEESFKKAQESYLPYYNITIVESGRSQEKFYQIHDTAHFVTHLANSPSSADPVTQRPIQNIHHFAIPCFQLDSKNICRPTDLHQDRISFLPMHMSSELLPLFLDSINENIFVTGKNEDKYKVRRTQYILASLIKQGRFFDHLEGVERKNEEIIWLWCSSKGSFRGLVNLANECLNSNLFDNTKAIVLNQLEHHSILDNNIRNTKESEAKIERIDLIKKLKQKN